MDAILQSLSFRRMSPRDWPQLRTVMIEAATRDLPDMTLQREVWLMANADPEVVEATLNETGNFCIVAEDQWRDPQGIAWIDELGRITGPYVSLRGVGLELTLVQALLNHTSAPLVQLVCTNENQAMQKLAQQLGFTYLQAFIDPYFPDHEFALYQAETQAWLSSQ